MPCPLYQQLRPEIIRSENPYGETTMLFRIVIVLSFVLGLFPLGTTNANSNKATCDPLSGCFQFTGGLSEIPQPYPMVKFSSNITATITWKSGVYSPTFASEGGSLFKPSATQHKAYLAPGTWTLNAFSMYVSNEDPSFTIEGDKSTRVFSFSYSARYITNTFRTLDVDSESWTPLGTFIGSPTETVKLMWEKGVQIAVTQGEIQLPYAPVSHGQFWGVWDNNPNSGNIPDYEHPELRYIMARGHGKVSLYSKSDFDLYRNFSAIGKDQPYVIDNNEHQGNTLALIEKYHNDYDTWPNTTQEGGKWVISFFEIDQPVNRLIYHARLPVDGKVFIYADPEVNLLGSPDLFNDYTLPSHSRADGFFTFNEEDTTRRVLWISASGKGIVIVAHMATYDYGYMNEGRDNLEVAYTSNDLPYHRWK